MIRGNGNKQISFDFEPVDNFSLYDYIRDKRDDELSEQDKIIKRKYNAKIREIQKVQCPHCKNNISGEIMDLGEMVVLINRLKGFRWETIPWGQMEMIKIMVQKYHHVTIKILKPDYHYAIMEMQNNEGAIEYQKWFNLHETNRGKSI